MTRRPINAGSFYLDREDIKQLQLILSDDPEKCGVSISAKINGFEEEYDSLDSFFDAPLEDYVTQFKIRLGFPGGYVNIVSGRGEYLSTSSVEIVGDEEPVKRVANKVEEFFTRKRNPVRTRLKDKYLWGVVIVSAWLSRFSIDAVLLRDRIIHEEPTPIDYFLVSTVVFLFLTVMGSKRWFPYSAIKTSETSAKREYLRKGIAVAVSLATIINALNALYSFLDSFLEFSKMF